MRSKARKFYATSMPGKSAIFVHTYEDALEEAKRKVASKDEEYYVVEIIHKVKREIPVIVSDFIGIDEV